MPTRPETELGWPDVLAALAARCRLPAGRGRALALPFLPTAEDAREALPPRARRAPAAARPRGVAGAGDRAVRRDLRPGEPRPRPGPRARAGAPPRPQGAGG